MDAITAWDLSVLQALQAQLRGPFLDALSKGMSALGDHGVLFLALAALMLCWKRTRVLGGVALTAILLDALLVNVLLKPLVGRARPFELLRGLSLIVPPPGDFSFPSGHTAVSFAFAFALMPAGRRVFIPAALFAALMGFTRLYLMVHFPTDVLAGAVCGMLCGIAAVLIWRKISSPPPTE